MLNDPHPAQYAAEAAIAPLPYESVHCFICWVIKNFINYSDLFLTTGLAICYGP